MKIDKEESKRVGITVVRGAAQKEEPKKAQRKSAKDDEPKSGDEKLRDEWNE